MAWHFIYLHRNNFISIEQLASNERFCVDKRCTPKWNLKTSAKLVSRLYWTEVELKVWQDAGPGLAQLVEHLAHRYSESTSSNPSNLTSATVCEDRTVCTPAAKRSASVAPEVDLGECTLHSPPQKANKAEPTLALNPRGDVTRNPKQGYQWPE